eukprot:s679_g3.t1
MSCSESQNDRVIDAVMTQSQPVMIHVGQVGHRPRNSMQHRPVPRGLYDEPKSGISKHCRTTCYRSHGKWRHPFFDNLNWNTSLQEHTEEHKKKMETLEREAKGVEAEHNNHLKDPESWRRAVESHVEARLVALQREARWEAGDATRQAQQAVGEFAQMRKRLQQEMNAQKQHIGKASANLSRMIDEVCNHGGALTADMGMPLAEIFVIRLAKNCDDSWLRGHKPA